VSLDRFADDSKSVKNKIFTGSVRTTAVAESDFELLTLMVWYDRGKYFSRTIKT